MTPSERVNQSLTSGAFVALENLPAGHAMHTAGLDPPSVVEYAPVPHAPHSSMLPMLPTAHVPATHRLHWLSPEAAYIPSGHRVQFQLPVSAFAYPIAHLVHTLPPAKAEYVPGRHALHPPLAFPALIRPRGHSRQAVALSSEYKPGGQSLHLMEPERE